MRVVGVDPGLAACGYAVVDADGAKAEALAYGCWHTDAGARVELRLRELYRTDLTDHRYSDALIANRTWVPGPAGAKKLVGPGTEKPVILCTEETRCSGVPWTSLVPGWSGRLIELVGDASLIGA